MMGSEEIGFVVGPSSNDNHPRRRPRILLTGFGPFSNYVENPAWLALKALEKRAIDELPTDNVEFIFRMIPVEYETVRETMPRWWDELRPEVIIHVGTGLPDGAIHVEQRSYNRGYCCKDVASLVPCENHCVENGPPSLDTEFDVARIVEEINAEQKQMEGLKAAKSSTNPGKFLCGFIYYQSLLCYSRRCLFVHVPPIDKDDDARRSLDDSKVTAENLAQGLKLIILSVLKQESERKSASK